MPALSQHLKTLLKKQLSGIQPLVYYGQTYRPHSQILLLDESTDQAVVYTVQPRLLKANRDSRARLAQLFSFYIFGDDSLRPCGSESVIGKKQTCESTIQHDPLRVVYRLNGQENTIELPPPKKYFAPHDIRFEPDYSCRPRLNGVDKQWLAPITHLLLSQFLKSLTSRPGLYGLAEIKFTHDDDEFKRGYIFLKRQRSRVCDLLVRKNVQRFSSTDEQVKFTFIDQVRLISADDSEEHLLNLQRAFASLIKRSSLKKLKARAGELLSLYTLYLPPELRAFYRS